MTAPSQQSMMDGLKKVGSDLGSLMMLPDADLDFLSQLQSVIVGYVRDKVGGGHGQGMGQGQGMGAGMGQGMGPGAMGGGQGAPSPTASPMSGPMMGLSQTGGAPGQPNADELARMLGGGGGAAT